MGEVSLRQALDDYYEFLCIDHRLITRKMYATVLEKLIQTLGPDTDVRTITPRDLNYALGMLLRPNLSGATKEKYKCIIRTFFNWLVEYEYRSTSPVKYKVQVVKSGPLDTGKAISDEDIERMLAACLNARDYALVMFFKCTALRLGAAWNLRVEGICPEEETITTCEIKGNQLRTVFMPDTLYEALCAWLEERAKLVEQLPGGDHGYVFTCLDNGERLAYMSLFGAMRRLGERAGVVLYSAHKFRHAWGIWAAKNGVPITETQAQMGHSSASTTWNFYYKSTPENLRKTVERRAHGDDANSANE